jgi:protein O-GlcNAc transferase
VASPNDLADALIAEGNGAEDSGRLGEACERYRKAVAAAPGYARAHLNLGIGLDASGDAEGALRSFEAALALEPHNPFANYNLGNLLFKRSDLGRSEECLRLALDSRPEFPEALVALANVLDARGDSEAAAAALATALRQRPDYLGALCNYAVVLRKLRRLAEAEAVLRRALAVDPACLPALEVLGGVLRAQARIVEALECFAAARKLAPERFDLESAELFTLSCSEDVSSESLFERHKAFGRRLEAATPPRFRFPRPADPGRRLRVGYVSGDFSRHPVALFLIPVIEGHDRKAFEVCCYSTGAGSDEVTQTLRDSADLFRDAASMSDDDLAEAIHGDGVDVLVDLSGHSGVYRLGVFARQPAPVQAAWLGYLCTTGLTRIRYRICDRHSDPEGLADRVHTETLVRLSHSQWCYRPLIPDLPAAANPPLAKNGFVTFGSFNHISKISPGIRRLWAEILERAPGSRLVIAGVPEGPAGDGLLSDLKVPRERITLLPHAPLAEYFRSFGRVDIALDTAPYSGGTTTCDALWMGVPVVTLGGARSMSRSAASLLESAGLPDWIAATPEDYVSLAAGFATDAARLAELRVSLRQRMRVSPIMDEAAFVRDLESAYRAMWRAWCEGRR